MSSAVKIKSPTFNVTSTKGPKSVDSNTMSCLICHKRLKAATISAPLIDKNSAKEKLDQISSLFEVSSSIYREVDLNEVPVPLLCSPCSETVVDAFKVQNATKILQKQLTRLTQIIKRDIVQSFHLDTQTPNEGTSSDCGQVKLIRKTYAQCWGTCEVRTIACDIPREDPSLPYDIDDEQPSPFSGYADDDVGESEGTREDGDENCWNADAVKSVVTENDMPNEERKLNAESITSNEIPSQPTLLEAESGPVVETLPSFNNSLGERKYPTTGVVPSPLTKNKRGLHSCYRCGMYFTKGQSLKNHLKKKNPCVNRNVSEKDTSATTTNPSINTTTDIGDSVPEDTVSSVVPIQISDDSATGKRTTRKKVDVSYNESADSDNYEDDLNCDSDSSDSECEEREPKRMKPTPTRRSAAPAQSSMSSLKSRMRCPECSVIFSSYLKLRIHRREVHGYVPSNTRVRESKIKCSQCDCSYTRQPALTRHVEKVHLGIIRIAKSEKCNLCDLPFTNLKQHMETQHAQHSVCPLCGENVNEEKLEHHIGLHNGSKDFPCQQCDARLPTYRACMFHIGRYHEDRVVHRKKMHKCKSCSREFSMFKDLMEHRKVHLKKRNLPVVTCTLCGSYFRTKEKQQRHMRFHVNGSRDFKCHFCNQTFEKLSLAKDHMNNEHAEVIQAALKCTLCGKIFRTEDRKNEHLSLHNGEMDFPCKECPARFSKELSFKGHMARSHQIPAQCWICKQICPSFADLGAHKKSEHGISNNFVCRARSYKCTFCPKAFTRKIPLTRHLMLHGGKANFHCTHCDAVFKTSKRFTFHLLLHEKGLPIPVERNFNYKCNVCEQRFDLQEFYELHMKKHENPDEIITRYIQAKVDDQKDVISFDCKICEQTFSKELHKNEETNQFEIICEHGNCPCKATFTDLKDFMYHHKKVCKVKYRKANFDMSVTCDECGQVCSNPKALNAHKDRMHPGPNSSICEICGKAFGQLYMLEYHMTTHTSEKNFQCHICGNKYKSKYRLNSHLRRTHSETRFPCDICGKKFKGKPDLRKHKNSVHTMCEPQFPCHICGKLFKTKNYVLNHVYSTHEKRRKPRDRQPPNHDGGGETKNNMEFIN